MATDELTAALNRENIALKAALMAAVLYPEAWHAVSSLNIQRGRDKAVDEILDTAAKAVRERS